MLSYVKSIRSYYQNIHKLIPDEIRERDQLKRELESIESSLLYTDEEKEIKKKGLEKRYIFAKRRVKRLNDFKENYKKLLPVMERAKDSINRFIFVVEESSYVYRDAYKTLKMQKDINNVYRTIKELQSLDYLSENIMKSWTDLENIIDTLTNQIEQNNYSSSNI